VRVASITRPRIAASDNWYLDRGESLIQISSDLKIKLLEHGVSTLHGSTFKLPSDCEFEPPCSIKWMQVHHSLKLGAFSYAVSGYYFGANIGRYTSIGESVQIGRGSHPVGWASTSPVFYQRHEDVVGFRIPEVGIYKPTAPYIKAEETFIGSDVYIGHGAFIMQGVRIGNGAVVGAHAVVTKDVPDFAIVAGSPARIRKMRFPNRIIERITRLAWWDYAFWEFKATDVSQVDAFLDCVDARIESGLLPFAPAKVKLTDLLGPE